MKTVNNNYVLGVMRLFNSEEYYMNATFALWVLRAVAGKSVECIDCKGRLYYDKQNPHYWIWKLTNDLIGRSWVSGYTFLLMGGTPNWSISNRRTGSNVFLSYEEARHIAEISNNKEQIQNLFKLRELSAYSLSSTNNPIRVIYELTNGLLEAFGALNENLIGEVKGKDKKPNDNLQVYWDTEKEEYRCFKKCNLIKIA